MPLDDLASRLDPLFAAADRSDAPGAVVAVALDGRSVYRRAFGLASIQLGVANQTSTRMRYASITKSFTAALALLLHEDRVLDLDAPVTRYLPELPTPCGVPTLRQFLHHTAGHRDAFEVLTLANGSAPGSLAKGAMVRASFRQQGVNFAPGQGQLYANSGYHLVCVAIDRAAGRPFETLLAECILQPLGLLDTEPVGDDRHFAPRLADFHVRDSGGAWCRGQFATRELRGEGSLIGTVDDLLRWAAQVRRPQDLGRPLAWRAWLERARLPDGRLSTYAGGLNCHRYRGIDVVQHSGWAIGGTAMLLTVPEHALDIAVLANGGPVSAFESAYRIVDAVLADALTEAQAPLASASAYRHLVGHWYHGSCGTLVGFDDVAGKLGLSYLAYPHVPVLRETADSLHVGFETVACGPLEFDATELRGPQAPATLTFRETGVARTLHRLAPAAHAPSFHGRYRCADLAAEFTGAAFDDGGSGRMTVRGDEGPPLALQLRALSRDVAIAHCDEDPDVRFVMTMACSTEGQVLGWRIDSLRARSLACTKVG